MKAELEDFNKAGWSGLSLAVKPEEIDQLIQLLGDLKAERIDYFHLRSTREGAVGIGDLEFSLTGQQVDDNLVIDCMSPLFPD